MLSNFMLKYVLKISLLSKKKSVKYTYIYNKTGRYFVHVSPYLAFGFYLMMDVFLEIDLIISSTIIYEIFCLETIKCIFMSPISWNYSS